MCFECFESADLDFGVCNSSGLVTESSRGAAQGFLHKTICHLSFLLVLSCYYTIAGTILVACVNQPCKGVLRSSRL